jgi:hypothetical protein
MMSEAPDAVLAALRELGRHGLHGLDAAWSRCSFAPTSHHGSALDDRPHIERLVDGDRPADRPLGRERRLLFCNDHYIAWAGRPREQLLGPHARSLFGAARGPPRSRRSRRRSPAARSATSASCSTAAARAAGRASRCSRTPTRAAASKPCSRSRSTSTTTCSPASAARTQRRLDRFTENIPYPLTYVDRDFALRFVNKAYCEATARRRRT